MSPIASVIFNHNFLETAPSLLLKRVPYFYVSFPLGHKCNGDEHGSTEGNPKTVIN